MRAKEYLNQLQKLDIVINQKIKELNDLKSLSQSVKSVDYSNERVKTSPCEEANFTKIINQILDLEKEIDCEIKVFTNKKHLMINQIQALQNSKEIAVLFQRYVDYYSFEEIAVNLNYSIRSVYRIHGKALYSFQVKHLTAI